MSETPETPALRELGWGVREVLHWLVDRVSAPQPADAATPAEVHAAIDDQYALASAPPAPPSEPIVPGQSYGGF